MKVKRRLLKAITSLVAAFLLLSLNLLPAFAQGTTDGTIAGTVVDQQGSVVPNAKVFAKNNATAQTFTATSGDNGSFRINNVPVATYTVTIEAPNFKTYLNANVEVQLNRITDVNATLQPGAVSETVTVTAGAAAELVETTTSQLGKSFEGRNLVELPVGTDANQLALLSPNVVTGGAGVLGYGGSVGGNRPRNNSFTLDGIDNNDVGVTGPQILPITDAVKEFTVLTNQFTAEFGHSSAGQFTTITKSGTNELHGALWWFNENKNLNALDHRFKESEAADGRNGDQVKRPRFDFNRIGADAGGRIIKDKLFWFGAFQYSTTGRAGSTADFLAPTAAGLAKLSSLKGVSPFTLGLFKNHVPVASSQADTVSVLGTPIPVGKVVSLVPSFDNTYQWQGNVDYNPSEKDQFRFRVLWDRFRQLLPGSPGAEFNGSFLVDNRFYALTDVHSFTPTLVNEVRLGYRHQHFGVVGPTNFTDFPKDIFPNIQIDELGLVIGPANGQFGFANVYQGTDNLNWTRGKHQLKVGFDYRNAIAPTNFLPRANGDYIFSMEDFFTDTKPGFAIKGTGQGTFAGNQQAFYTYAQDDFKLKPNFTLNFGIRYEYTTNARDAKTQNLNKISDVDASDPTLATIHKEFPGLFPNGIHFRTPKTDKNNWAPRVGFAWAPNFEHGWLHKIFGGQNQSSIRAGFGIAYDVLFQNLVLLQLPPQLQQEVDASSGSGGRFGTDTNFLANGGVPSGGAVDPAFFTDRALARSLTQGLIIDQQTPYTIAWSLAYQREFMKNWALEVRYLGTRGVHLFVQDRYNGGVVPNFFLPVFFNQSDVPGASTLSGMKTLADFLAARRRPLAPLGFVSNFTLFPAAGNSIYHAGSINLKHRFAKGLYWDTSYTYSRTIDDSTNELFSSFVNPRRPQDFFNLRPERSRSVLDRPHRFVSSWIYELPFFHNQHGVLGQVLGNWQISGVYQVESGQPINAISFRDLNGNRDVAGDLTIINVNGDRKKGTDVLAVTKSRTFVPLGSVPSSQVVGYVAKDPNAFWIRGDAGARATAGRNTLKADYINNWDIAVFKRFPITENHRVEFRADFFNAFNHPQFYISGDDPTFGSLPFVIPGDPRFLDKHVYGGHPRAIQLQLRYRF